MLNIMSLERDNNFASVAEYLEISKSYVFYYINNIDFRLL